MDIDTLIENAASEILSEKNAEKSQDQRKKSGYESQRKNKTNRQGNINKGLTNKHAEEYKNKIRKDKRLLTHSKNTQFPQEIIEHVQGEIVEDTDLRQFQEMYLLTCEHELEEFKENNADLVKKHPNIWYRQVLAEIKKNTPKVTIDDIDKLEVIFDCLNSFLFKMGLCVSFSLFQQMTNTYEFQYDKLGKVNPKYNMLVQKIYYTSKNALITELSNNPVTQANKYYLGKSIYGLIEKSEAKQIEIVHKVDTIDDIPIFGIEQKAD